MKNNMRSRDKTKEMHLIRPPRLEGKIKNTNTHALKKPKKPPSPIDQTRQSVEKNKKIFLRQHLVDELKAEGILRKKNIAEAMSKIDRVDFVPLEVIDYAHEDEALPIGHGQTISQPSTVAFMLDLLDVKVGSHVFDVGSGSCWLTAILAELVGKSGHVYAMEIISELYEFGKENIQKYKDYLSRVTFYCANAKDGLIQEYVTYLDRIIVSAEVNSVPSIWKEQLSEGGILVYPKDGMIIREVKLPNGEFEKNEFLGFSFVPFR